MNSAQQDKHHTWDTLSSKIVYQNPWICVREDTFVQPDGNVGLFDVVEKDDYVIIIPIIDDKVVMVEQYRYPIRQRSLEFPQGMSAKGEDLETGARRELEEETGMVCDTLTSIGNLWLACGYHTQRFNIFAAKGHRGGRQRLEGSEHDLVIKEYSLNDVTKMILLGTIKDSPSVSSFFLYLQRFQ